MKSIIQILSGALLIFFAFSANAQTKPIVKPKYDTKTIYKPSNKKSYKTIKSKQKKSGDKKYVVQLKGGQFVFVNLERYCQQFANTDCDEMPSACHEYYSRCEDDDDGINEPASRFAVVDMSDRGGEIPDECQVFIDNCYPNPRLSDFRNFLHTAGEQYQIYIKSAQGKTIAYTNTKYAKNTMNRRMKFSKFSIRQPKFKGKAYVKVVNLKTKKSRTYKTVFK